MTGRKIAVSQSHTKGASLSLYLVQQKDENCQNRTGETYKQLIGLLLQCLVFLARLLQLRLLSLVAEKARQQVSEIFFANGLKYYTHNYSPTEGFFFFLLLLILFSMANSVSDYSHSCLLYEIGFITPGRRDQPALGNLSRLRNPLWASQGKWWVAGDCLLAGSKLRPRA